MIRPAFNLTVILMAAGLLAQPQPSFEVASIRVHAFNSPNRSGTRIDGNRFTTGGNLYQLIIYAYDLKSYQLSGGPTWAAHPSTDGDYYDINAKSEGDAVLSQPRARQLLQTLLSDRFHLRLHHEMKEMPVYDLIVGPGGPKFQESGAETTSRTAGSVSLTAVRSIFQKSSMDALVRVLSGAMDRPVLDQTRLRGLYDYKLEFARDPAAAADQSSPSSVFTAVTEQLGLKLKSDKASIEICVIDHAERPTEN